jgi:hypothetical protein
MVKRWLRNLLPNRHSVAQPPAQSGNVLFSIDHFVIFSGMLRVAGWISKPGCRLDDLRVQVAGIDDTIVDRHALPSPDVADAIGREAHHARFEGRWFLDAPASDVVDAQLIARFSDGSVTVIERLGAIGSAADASTQLVNKFLSALRSSQPGTLLEVGSRARSGVTRRHLIPDGWGYKGLDILAGKNVDKVGDAHRLSVLFPTERFDAMMSFSVLEHLLMPWKFAIELNRVLRPGAIGLFCTHQTWPLHDQPWDFWRFSAEAWSALLNPATGFEIIEACVGEPAFVVASRCHPATNFGGQPEAFLASSVMFRKIGETRLAWDVDVQDVINNSYPTQTTNVRL